eukprot:601017-Prymnesium_polylepis.1
MVDITLREGRAPGQWPARRAWVTGLRGLSHRLDRCRQTATGIIIRIVGGRHRCAGPSAIG